MQTEKISLTGAQATLLITLHCKAVESRLPDSLLNDRLADEIVRKIDYDFSRVDLGRDGAISLALRAKSFDDWTRAFIAKHEDAVVLNLGCGLDSRVFRVGPPAGISWFDVDLHDVIDLRQRLYPARTGDYRRIGASVTETAWLSEIPRDRPAIVVAEGLMPYLPGEEAPKLIARLAGHFPSGEIAFDAYSRFGLAWLRVTPQFRVTGAKVHWALDDAKGLEAVAPGLKLVEEKVQFDSDQIARMSLPARLTVTLFRVIPALRKVGRLLRYRFGVQSA